VVCSWLMMHTNIENSFTTQCYSPVRPRYISETWPVYFDKSESKNNVFLSTEFITHVIEFVSARTFPGRVRGSGLGNARELSRHGALDDRRVFVASRLEPRCRSRYVTYCYHYVHFFERLHSSSLGLDAGLCE
jgi:hypothetical protein